MERIDELGIIKMDDWLGLSKYYDDQLELLKLLYPYKNIIELSEDENIELTETLSIGIFKINDKQVLEKLSLHTEKGTLTITNYIVFQYTWHLCDFIPNLPNLSKKGVFSIGSDRSGSYEIPSFKYLNENTQIKEDIKHDHSRCMSRGIKNSIYYRSSGYSYMHRGCCSMHGWNDKDKIYTSSLRKWMGEIIQYLSA